MRTQSLRVAEFKVLKHYNVDFERIKQALLILQANDFNFTKTFKGTGVSRRTLKRWMQVHGEKVFSIPIPRLLPVITEDVARRNGIDTDRMIKFLVDAFALKEEIVRRIAELLVKIDKIESRDIDKFAKALKIIHDITLADQPQPQNTTNNYLQVISQQLEENIKRNTHEPAND